ncbi:MAG: DUF3341 domain-containing protein [Bacteroidota bacterium]|nr:DUF3341 domain-containing protein [Bacteroidota bacterium]
MIKITRTPAIVAVFDDDDTLKDAIRLSNDKGYKILDCFTPFPVHGLERLLDLKYSRLGYAAFAFACLGFLIALSMMSYMLAVDWPINYGGKPTWPLASFIPIMFELSVLVGSIGMVVTYMWVCGLSPGVEPVIYEIRATDDRFVLLIEEGSIGDNIRNDMIAMKAEAVRNDDYITHNFPGPVPIRLK